MSRRKKAIGLTLFSVGVGMLIVLIIPGWGWLLVSSLILLISGFFLIKK
ncbi:MAG: hypothetical protein GX347_06280 [Epulopiscium sp.]|nr:hypothetical protein [Candidatus Epulonipiscium sp.]